MCERCNGTGVIVASIEVGAFLEEYEIVCDCDGYCTCPGDDLCDHEGE